MSTLTASAGVAIWKPPWPVAEVGSMLSMLPGTMTLWPTSEAACSACICVNCDDSDCTVVFSVLMPVTVLICAISLVTWALSIGLSGSWFCICATRSFKKESALTVELDALEAAGVDDTITLGVDVAALTLMVWFPSGSASELNGFEQQRFRRVHGSHEHGE